VAATAPNTQHTESQPLFVGRKQVKLRRLVGQENLVDALSSHNTARVIFPEEMTGDEAIQVFGRHRVILMPIGSAKFNLVFCRPGTQVICIAPQGYAEAGGGVSLMLRHMCSALGLNLAIYACRSVPSEGQRSHMQLHNDLVLEIEEVLSMLAHFASLSR
jgi:capsular polysaccharide biosynthesis protein